MNFYRLCVLGLLVLSPVSISNLHAKTETTPLNELSHPDERALYCKRAMGERMMIFMSREKNMVEAMKTIGVIQSWDGEINRILGGDERYQEVSHNVNTHWAKHFGTYVKNASDAEIKERMKILDKEAVNCQDELTKYKKRSKPTPYVVAKKDTKAKPKSLTSSPKVPAQKKSVQKKPTPKKPAQKTKAQPKQHANTIYVGNWKGAVKQPGAVAYSIEMNIWLNNENKLVGISDYPELKCSGSLTQDNSLKNSSVSFIESKVNAPQCSATGKIKLTRADDGSINWQWFYSHGQLGATAKIIKAQVSARMAQIIQAKKMPKAVAKVKNKEPQKMSTRQESKKATKTPNKEKQRKDNKTALNVNSFNSKGLNYEDGFSAFEKKDYVTAINIWKKLAEAGNVKSQNSLGYMYETGNGVKKNLKEAFKWYKKSAEQGFSKGQYNVGLMYHAGRGVSQNFEAAAKWYRLAAAQGDVDAKKLLQDVVQNKEKQRKVNKTALNVNSFTSKGLNYESELMAIYLGDFKHARLKRGGLAVSGMFRKYLKAYGTFCDAYLPKDKVPITVRECARERVTTNGYGAETDRTCVEWVDVPTGLYADPDLYYSSNRASRQAGKQVVGTMFNFNDPYGSRALVDDAVSLGNDMENLVKKNKCNSIGLRRFGKNLSRFVENESPLMLPGKQTLASTMSSQPVSFNAASINIKSLIDDLILENSKGWMMNRYRSGSVSNLVVRSRNSNGSPRRVTADYQYTGMGNTYKGNVALTFANNMPQCLFFSDAPKTCRHPSRGIINKYERGKYSK